MEHNKKVSQTRIVKPTESPKNESLKFGSASCWTHDHLKELGVTLVVKKHWDWKTELGPWKYTPEQEDRSFISPSSLILGIKDASDQLRKHDIALLARNKNSDNVIRDLQDFKNTYRSIIRLVQNKNEPQQATTTPNISTNVESSSSQSIARTSQKRPLDDLSSPSSIKRQRPDPSKTPDQVTVLPNPYNSGDTNVSGRSDEATDEEATRELITTFVTDATGCLMQDFRDLAWSKSKVETQIQVSTG